MPFKHFIFDKLKASLDYIVVFKRFETTLKSYGKPVESVTFELITKSDHEYSFYNELLDKNSKHLQRNTSFICVQ